jgi:hypothetical protein
MILDDITIQAPCASVGFKASARRLPRAFTLAEAQQVRALLGVGEVSPEAKARVRQLIAEMPALSGGAVTAFWYGTPLSKFFGATSTDKIDWVNDTIKMSLHTSSYSPNQDTNTYFSDTTNELTTAGGYTAGGNTLGTKSIAYNGATNTSRLIAATSTWSTATFTARYAVIYKSTGTGSTSILVCYIDFGTDQSPAGVNFSVAPDATDGFARIVAS